MPIASTYALTECIINLSSERKIKTGKVYHKQKYFLNFAA